MVFTNLNGLHEISKVIKFVQNTVIAVLLNTSHIITILVVFCVNHKKVVEIANKLYTTKKFFIISNTQGILINKVVFCVYAIWLAATVFYGAKVVKIFI